MVSTDVTYYNQEKIISNTLNTGRTDTHRTKFSTFAVNDTVRFAKARLPFSSCFEKTFTDEVFDVHSVSKQRPIIFKLVDKNHRVVETSFYESELVKATI